jgi:VWFA-related protein
MPNLVVVLSILAFLLVLPGAGPLYAQAPEGRFSERAFVTAIDVVAEVRDAGGKTPDDLTPSDFRLLENGTERKIIAVEYLDPSRPPDHAPAPAAPSGVRSRTEWQVVVWFDAMTMSRATLSHNVRELARRASELLAFGPVTLVYSDLSPEIVIDSTRDPKQLAGAIETIMKRPPGDRIAKIRREFLTGADNVTETTLGGPSPAPGRSEGQTFVMGAVDTSIPNYVAEEERLLEIGRRNLSRWLQRFPRKTPRMLVYVGDGFDVDPVEFYIQVVQASGDFRTDFDGNRLIDLDKARSGVQGRTRIAAAALARQLAIAGWTALAIGGTNANFADDVTRGTGRRFSTRQAGAAPAFLFLNPADPLIQLAEETGGERITTAAALPGALQELRRRVRITYQVSREPDPTERRVEIVPLRAGLRVRAPEWVTSTTTEGVAEARAIDLLSGAAPGGELNVSASLRRPSGSEPASVETRVDFDGLGAAADRVGATKLRMTLAVELPGEPPVTVHQLVDVDDLGAVPGLVWTAPINLPIDAASVAVVVEELTTGMWGGARIASGAASAPAASGPLVAPPPRSMVSALPSLDRDQAFARAAAERKLVLAFEWDKCRTCDAIYERGRAHPEVARRMQAFVVLAPAPAPDPGVQPRVALYDASGELFISWPAIGSKRAQRGLSPGDLTVILQRAAAAAPYLFRAQEQFAAGEVIDAQLAVASAYQEAEERALAETAYGEAERVAIEHGGLSRAQTARVLRALMAANQGRHEDAMNDLSLVAASPETPLNEAEAQLVMSMILRADGRDKEAAAALDRALLLAPEGSAAYAAARSLSGGGGGASALASSQSVATRPLQLVVGGKPPFSGKTRLQVIVRDPKVSSVAFRVDDGKEVVDARPPFETTVDLGATPRRRELRAVARDAKGRALAEDAVVLNERHDEFWLRLRSAQGSEIIRAETNVPAGATVAKIEFFVDGRPAAPLPADPAALRVAADEGVVVRAAATLQDGRTAEDATLFGGYGFTETIEARDVEIYASVLDSAGAPIAGLDRSQFTVAEDGRTKRLSGFEFLGRAPFSVGIAIDSSSSMIEAMPDVHRSARAFLSLAARDGSSAFVVDFDTTPRLAAARTDNLPLLHAAVSQIQADGSTALYDAMIFGLLQLQGVPGKRALIVLTDGLDATSRYGLKDAIAVARESGVAIYAIILNQKRGRVPDVTFSLTPAGSAGGAAAPGAIYGVRGGRRIGADPQIEKIAVESGGRAWHLPESADMDAIYAEIDRELRNQYRLTYRTAPGRGATDWREVKVTVDVPGAKVRAAAGFVAR